MAISRNNLLIYYADLQTVGGATSISAAVGILMRYDAIVMAVQTSGNVANSIEILYELKKIKPGIKIFGYTDLGGSADYTAWQVLADAWIAAIPATLLDGLFLDNFGFTGSTTRTSQNQAVTYCHSNGTVALSAFASAADSVDALGTLPSAADPVLGRSATITDYILMPGFFYSNDNAVSPTLEGKEELKGRLEYLEAALVNTGSPLTLWNILTAVTVGGGTMNGISSDAYTALLNSINSYDINFLSVNPYDFGATGNKYFYQYRPNTFTD